jgi:hypothetical protein
MPTSISAVISIRLSCFGGRLRRGQAGWRWSDGASEGRISDQESARLDLPCREVGGRRARRLVEVPWSLAEAFDGLQWVVEGFNARRYEVDVDRGSHPALAGRVVGTTAQGEAQRVRVGDLGMVALVPEEHWKAWRGACRVVPLWKPRDEAPLRERAGTLGWTP